ncbi:hypothetical protein [Mesoaciditoga sp.]
MKKIFIMVLIAVLLGTLTSFATLTSYVQMHKVKDGGYVDTPTVVSRYGKLVETVYMQKLAQEYGKSFVNSDYFKEYFDLLKTHASYFKVPTWVHYTVFLSSYMKDNGMKVDTKFLNAVDNFLNQNLKDYTGTYAYFQMVADGLLLEKLLGKNLNASPFYKTATKILNDAIAKKTYANAGITILVALIKVKGKKVPRDLKTMKFLNDHISYVNGDYMREYTLLKAGYLNNKEVGQTLKNPDIQNPQQLFFYKELCEDLKIPFNLKQKFEIFEMQRAPFGGYYNLGSVSSVSDTYWATKILSMLGKKADRDYWEQFTSNLVSAASAYPVNVLAVYLEYALEMNEHYMLLNKSQIRILINSFYNKMNLSPALEAYYLATFNFDRAFQLLKVIQRTDYKNDKVFMDIHTVLDRLFKGLNKMDSSKKNISYYYDYVQLLNFAHDFGYEVNEKNAQIIGEKFIAEIKSRSLTDLNLLRAAWALEKNYGLNVDKSFFAAELKKLKDVKSGGYFYNLTDGIESFQSTYEALTLLKEL